MWEWCVKYFSKAISLNVRDLFFLSSQPASHSLSAMSVSCLLYTQVPGRLLRTSKPPFNGGELIQQTVLTGIDAGILAFVIHYCLPHVCVAPICSMAPFVTVLHAFALCPTMAAFHLLLVLWYIWTNSNESHFLDPYCQHHYRAISWFMK